MTSEDQGEEGQWTGYRLYFPENDGLFFIWF
jgi:hypothetical protein